MRSIMLDLWNTVKTIEANTGQLIRTAYAISVPNRVNSFIQRLIDKTTFCQENDDKQSPSVVRIAQEYTDIYVLSSKPNTTVLCLVHLFLKQFSKNFFRYFIDHLQSLLVFLHVETFRKNTDAEDTGPELTRPEISLPVTAQRYAELLSESSKCATDM